MRKAIEIPAFDSTRMWPAWQAEQDQIEALEETEQRLNTKRKLERALIKARLYVMPAYALRAGEMTRDVASPWYGEPQYYEHVGEGGVGFVRIHPSRVVRLIGLEVPDPVQDNNPWGDPVSPARSFSGRHGSYRAPAPGQDRQACLSWSRHVPMNSQPRFFISSMAFGKTTQTCEFGPASPRGFLFRLSWNHLRCTAISHGRHP